jgi:Phycobilisome degradation protein nblA
VSDSQDFYSLTKESGMSQPVELSLEQQFSIRSFETQVQQMSHEQAQDFLIKLYEQMVMRETMYRHFLKGSPYPAGDLKLLLCSKWETSWGAGAFSFSFCLIRAL